jgi:CRISPR-associated exonuclease Cas4
MVHDTPSGDAWSMDDCTKNGKDYSEEDLLPLSGIQHFHFCKRQWGLIHIERQWADDLRTTEGHHIHRKADDPFFNESRGEVVVTRSVPLVSYKLGLRGIADVVEYTLSEDGIDLPGHEGLWQVKPIEYKRGKPKIDARDEVQLCAQAICLEEMFNVQIKKADFFYHEIRRRTSITLTDDLRDLVAALSHEMHDLFRKGTTPPAEAGKPCRSCSLFNICIPNLTKKRIIVDKYISKHVREAVKKDE